MADFFADLNSKLKPFGESISRQFVQVQQLAKEKMGTANPGDVTDLPAEYKELEEKVDRIRLVHENFLKVTRTFTLPQNDYSPPVADSVFDFATSVGENMRGFAVAGARAAGVNEAAVSPSGSMKEGPKNVSHALARAAAESAELVGEESPFGSALVKFSQTYEALGEAKLKMDHNVVNRFHQPFNNILNQLISNAVKSRKNVHNVRLNYDAARARLKNAKPERVEAVRSEMEVAEDEFVAAVDDAMGKMKIVVEHPDALKYLADFCAAQLAYYKECYEKLSKLSPEIDELQVANEALMQGH